MSNQLESNLSQALSIRLKMQVSLSQLPIVEEWMDIHLTRWLESVPLPPELPMGHLAHFNVTIAADLSQLRWAAYGNPTGFIPKMTEYLAACKMSPADVQLLDELGNRLEPRSVGSWIDVSRGEMTTKMTTGWHFCDEHPFAGFESLFGDHEARQKLVAWSRDAGVDRVCRFAQSIGEKVSSEVEFTIPGVAIDDQLSRVSSAFDALSGAPLPEYAIAALSSAVSPGFAVTARIEQGTITRVSVLSPGLGNDVIAQLCGDAGIEFDRTVVKLQAALGADGADRVEYIHTRIPGAIGQHVAIHVIPTDADSSAAGEIMN
ncbi:MAG: hypothetical protein MJE77_47295 [Proteobacteria bacterium]|nr:hypothetical protein [Pseudomonadota bacterium]